MGSAFRTVARHRAAVAAAIFLAVVLVRLPFATTQLWAWDSVLYARALEQGFHVDADPSASRPHPPGYLWYVGAAQLARAVLADSNAALVLVSILASAAGAALIWLVASRWMRPGTALVVAGAYAASPLVWTYSEVAYPYTLLALISLAVGVMLVEGHRPLATSLAIGVLSGARQDILILLAPLWVWSVWGLGARRVAAAMGLGALGVLTWWIPSAILSGGPVAYANALLRQTGHVAGTYSAPANGLAALGYNAAFTFEALFWGLGLFAVPLLVAIARAGLRAWRGAGRALDRRTIGLALWILPAIAFYALVHIGEWGYVLSVLPALFLAAGLALERARMARSTRGWIAAGVLAVAVPAVVFVGGDGAYGAIVGGAEFSAAALAEHDAGMRVRVAYVRQRFSAQSTVVLSRDDYQLVRYYLPEYRAWYWDPDPYVNAAKRKRAMRPTTVVIFTGGLQPLRTGEIKRIELAPGIDLAYLDIDRGAVLELDGERYVLREPPGR